MTLRFPSARFGIGVGSVVSRWRLFTANALYCMSRRVAPSPFFDMSLVACCRWCIANARCVCVSVCLDVCFLGSLFFLSLSYPSSSTPITPGIDCLQPMVCVCLAK